MGIKAYPVVQTKQVFMHCDLCDTLIPKGEFQLKPGKGFADFTSSDACYAYICPSCGHVQYNQNSYPATIAQYDMSKPEDLEYRGQITDLGQE